MERRVASLTTELHATQDQLLKTRRENVAKVTSLQQQLDEKSDTVTSLVSLERNPNLAFFSLDSKKGFNCN